MNGGLTSINGNGSQFPGLKPQAPQDPLGQPSGPSPFPPLSASAFNPPPKEDTLSLSKPSAGLSAPGPDAAEGNALSKPTLPSANLPAPFSTKMPPFAPLFAFPPTNPAFPALANAQSGQQSLNPLQNALGNPASPANSSLAGADSALLPPLPTVGQASQGPVQAATGAAKPVATGSAQSLPVGTNALSPAQQTGKQVGDIVTKLLEEVPALQEKIDHIDWDSLSQEEVMPKLEKLRVSVQPTYKRVPKFVDHKLARLFEDPQSQKMATQFFDWLRKEPDPEMLASLEREGSRQHGGRLGSSDFDDEMDSPRPHRRPSMSEDDFADDEASISPEKKGLINKLRAKTKDTISKIKDKISPKSEDRLSSHSGRPGRRQRDDFDFSDSSDDLDSLLRSAHGSDDFGPELRKHRPMRND